MDAQPEVAQVAAGIRLLRVGTVLVARRDEFDGGDELPVEIDVYGQLRVQSDRDASFQVRLLNGRIGRRFLGWRFRPPLPDADIGFAVARGYRQGGHTTEKRLVALGQTALNPLDQIREPERVDAVPAPFIRPI